MFCFELVVSRSGARSASKTPPQQNRKAYFCMICKYHRLRAPEYSLPLRARADAVLSMRDFCLELFVSYCMRLMLRNKSEKRFAKRCPPMVENNGNCSLKHRRDATQSERLVSMLWRLRLRHVSTRKHPKERQWYGWAKITGIVTFLAFIPPPDAWQH